MQIDTDAIAGDRLSLRVKYYREKAGYQSRRKLARDTNNSPAKIANLERGDFDVAKDGISSNALRRIADALGVTLDTLLPPKKRLTRHGVTAALIMRFLDGNSRIQQFSDLLDFCDVYDEPKDDLTYLYRVGPNSQLAKESTTTDPNLLQIDFESWSLSRRKPVFKRQRRAWDSGFILEAITFQPSYITRPKETHVALTLAAGRVLDFDGTDRLLVCCEARA